MYALTKISLLVFLLALLACGGPVPPPDHLLVFYPTAILKTGTNATLGFDPPHFNSAFSGLFYNVSMVYAPPSGVRVPLGGLVTSGCAGGADGESEAQESQQPPRVIASVPLSVAGK